MTSMSGRRLDRGDQRPLDLGAGGVAAGVGDPVAVVAALAGQRQVARRGWSKLRAQRDELADGVGSLGDQDPHGLAVADAGAGDQGVVLVLLGGVARARARRRCRPAPTASSRRTSTSLVTTRTVLDLAAERSAAVRPAMPEPMTTTSACVVQPAASGAAAGRGGRSSRRG